MSADISLISEIADDLHSWLGDWTVEEEVDGLAAIIAETVTAYFDRPAGWPTILLERMEWQGHMGGRREDITDLVDVMLKAPSSRLRTFAQVVVAESDLVVCYKKKPT